MKDIKDYIHLYLDCEVLIETSSYWCVHEHDYHKGEKRLLLPHMLRWIRSGDMTVKLLLRPLSDMTECEAKTMVLLRSPIGSVKDDDRIVILEAMTDGKRIKWHLEGVPNIPRFVNTDELNPWQFLLLLSKGFDLFGLCEAGLAIGKTKLPAKV